MSNPFFVQVGLGEFAEYSKIVTPTAREQFEPIPLLDEDYHCWLIEPQVQALSSCLAFAENDPYLKPYKDRITFCSFAITPYDSIYDLSLRAIDNVDNQAQIDGVDNDWKHESNYSHKVAGISLDTLWEHLGGIDCLALDIQGLEANVLLRSTHHPRVLIVEIHSPQNHSRIIDWASKVGYTFHGDIAAPPERPNLLMVKE